MLEKFLLSVMVHHGMSSSEFEIIDHTADVGIKAFGKSINELFENAAKGMFHLIQGGSRVESIETHYIQLENRELDELLVDWLSELNFLHQTEMVLFSDFKVQVGEDGLQAEVRGERLDNDIHKVQMEIKAVTYHMLEVNLENGFAQVLFDI